MRVTGLWPLLTAVLGVSALTPTKTQPIRRNNNGRDDSSRFVKIEDGQFKLNGSEFRFVGTNAYWLQSLNSEDDIVTTFRNLSASGITVVRTWAFNDVAEIPADNGTWFQLIHPNGTAEINNSTTGLQKLDSIVRIAEEFGIHLLFTLTNNWNPLNETLSNSTASADATNRTTPRGTLSNDYGGMDTYVRQTNLTHHDQFYTNDTLFKLFANYTTQVVSRYVNSSAILAWEVANDPRCYSTLPSAGCKPTTITSWLHNVTEIIRATDPNHLITGGSQGFFCVDCPKLFPRPPAPVPSAGLTSRKAPALLTRARLLLERKEFFKRRFSTRKAAAKPDGVRIRGKWVSTPTRRQFDINIGPAYDGSQGVDSEDIINIPQISFGTFQLFPDQNTYGVDDPDVPSFNNTVDTGLEWIRRHAEVSRLFGKPISLTGFGLVTKDNVPFFTPFNSSTAPFNGTQSDNSTNSTEFGVSNEQRTWAYEQWLEAGIASGLQGIIQYQWGQSNLTALPNTTITPNLSNNSTGTDENIGFSGVSPNDGYSIQGVGKEDVQEVFKAASQELGNEIPPAADIGPGPGASGSASSSTASASTSTGASSTVTEAAAATATDATTETATDSATPTESAT